ncbi:hypothetical protein [Aquimarina agarivorans]|uniref:hypothetical protein n=1 Tax=Aquimarina agarivorans TaxID=980584 RepID=UPI000248EC24|nr:hypothetical protein [Aquimarina agarivorans]
MKKKENEVLFLVIEKDKLTDNLDSYYLKIITKQNLKDDSLISPDQIQAYYFSENYYSLFNEEKGSKTFSSNNCGGGSGGGEKNPGRPISVPPFEFAPIFVFPIERPGGGKGDDNEPPSGGRRVPVETINPAHDNELSNSDLLSPLLATTNTCHEGHFPVPFVSIHASPCEHIKKLMNRTPFNNKFQELKGKTNLKHETGFLFNHEGKPEALPLGKDEHTLKISLELNTTGYTHTHLDPYEGLVIDEKTGNLVPGIIKPFRIFSPTDVTTFLKIAKFRNDPVISGDVESAYGGVITSTGKYFLKYTGKLPINIESIINPNENEIERLKESYEEIMKKNSSSVEKGFLKFLKKEFNLNGLQLYKVKDDRMGKIQLELRELSTDQKRIIKKPC